MEDRKYFLPQSAQNQSSMPGAQFNTYRGSNPVISKTDTAIINHWTSGMKPKSILVEKQPSDPNLPIGRELGTGTHMPSALRRPNLQRGFSDRGGARVKKRVTLRYAIC